MTDRRSELSARHGRTAGPVPAARISAQPKTTQDLRRGGYRFLVSDATSPCGVEAFARHLHLALAKAGIEASLAVTDGGIARSFALGRRMRADQHLVVSLPIVAWKRKLIGPWLALLAASIKGCRVTLVLHEWADLDWRRRFVLSASAALARRVVFSSPLVATQFDRSVIGRVRRSLGRPSLGLVPIPPNICRPEGGGPTALSQELARERAAGRLVIAQFGSIYPKKQSILVLDIAAELKRRGYEVRLVFIGSFVKGHDTLEADFYARADALGVGRDVLVTGYLQTDADIFAAFGEVDAFVYDFAEGLSSRRGSVLACLQSGRPVIVNAPDDAGEFEHHPAYRHAIREKMLRLVPRAALAADFADAILAAVEQPGPAARVDFDACWEDAARALLTQSAGR